MTELLPSFIAGTTRKFSFSYLHCKDFQWGWPPPCPGQTDYDLLVCFSWCVFRFCHFPERPVLRRSEWAVELLRSSFWNPAEVSACLLSLLSTKSFLIRPADTDPWSTLGKTDKHPSFFRLWWTPETKETNDYQTIAQFSLLSQNRNQRDTRYIQSSLQFPFRYDMALTRKHLHKCKAHVSLHACL